MPLKLKPTSVIKADLGIQPNGPVHAYFTNTCYRYMDKYVPQRDGNLRRDVEITTNAIQYNSQYAHYQYEGILYVDPETGSSWARKDVTKVPTGIPLNYSTPGTGPHWDERMWSAEGQDVVKEVQAFINRGGK